MYLFAMAMIRKIGHDHQGLIRGAPDPPYPPYGGAKVFFWGVCLIYPSVKYFWEAVDL